MVVYGSMYLSIYLYTVAKIKNSTPYYSGSTERNFTKFSQCEEGLNTKYCFYLGSIWVSGTPLF